jgi:hypothetical protein
MAKVPFSKLQACINGSDCQNFYYNRAGEEVRYEVRHYLPIKEKLELVSKIINQSVDDNGFYNPMKVKLYTVLEVVYAYTNLSFTDKMKEDPFKLYDILVSTGIFADIVAVIRENDWKEIQENVWTTIDNIYKYKNSVMGILESISGDYNNLSLEASEIQKKLTQGEGIEFLQEVMTKLG